MEWRVPVPTLSDVPAIQHLLPSWMRGGRARTRSTGFPERGLRRRHSRVRVVELPGDGWAARDRCDGWCALLVRAGFVVG